MIDRLITSFIISVIFLFPGGAFAQPGNNMGFMTLPEMSSSITSNLTPTPAPTPTPTDPRFERYQPIMVDTECFFYGKGCEQFEEDPSGLHFYDTQTGKIFKYKPVNDVPLCHDPYYCWAIGFSMS